MKLFDYAIKMELDGEQYYLKQAANNKEHALNRVFTKLAEVEQKHAALLRNRSQGLDVGTDMTNLAGEPNVFSELADFKANVTSIPRQLDVYETALAIEQKSIAAYEQLAANVTAASDQALIAFLIEQEKQHYALFDELLTLLRRPEDWVEDAEFGKRDEY